MAPPEGDQSLTMAIDGDITFLTNANNDVPTAEAVQFLYSGIYRYDASLTPVPDLATAPAEISDDGLEWTITLVDNATFQPSGDPLTAADVVFTYEMANNANCRFNPSVCLAFVLVDDDDDPATDPVPVLESVEEIDAQTVKFTLAAPYAPFATVSLTIGIDSKAAVEAAFADFQENVSDVDAAEVQALVDRIVAEEDAPTGEPEDPAASPLVPTVDLVQFRAEIEAFLNAAAVPLPLETTYTVDGAFDEAAFVDAERALLDELNLTLTAEAADQIAAAYQLLEISRAPVGSGPFYVTEFRPGQDLTYAANPGYHHGEPQIKNMYLPIIKDDVAGASALSAGDIDWKYSMTADSFAQLENDPNVKFVEYPDFGYFGLMFNLREGALFAEKEVRQAVAYCIDKAAMVSAATADQAVPVYADIPPASWAFNPDLPKYEVDVAKANQLLEDAGWVAGADGIRAKGDLKLETTVLVRAGRPDRIAFMTLLADAVNTDCGMNISIQEADFTSVLLPGLEFPHIFPGTQKPWDAYFGGWGTGFDPDPYSIFHGSQCTTAEQPDTYNYVCFQNDDFDKLVEDGLKELDQDARAAIYQQTQAILAEELPYLFAWSDRAREGLRTTVNLSDGELPLDTPTFFWEVEKLTNAESAQ